MLAFHLDRADPTPLHHQLAQALEDAIVHGRLAPGDRVEQEVTLSRRLGISRNTVRLALDHLVHQGLLVRRPGYGTHVVRTPRSLPSGLLHLRDLDEHDQHTSTTVLVNELLPAPADVAAALRIPPEHLVLHLRRLRLSDGEPLAVLENYLPGQLADVGGHDLAVTSLYTAMERTGIRLRVAIERIGARIGADTECDLLRQPSGTVVLTRRRLTHDEFGRPVEFGDHAYRSDRFTYSMTLVSRRTEHGTSPGINRNGSTPPTTPNGWLPASGSVGQKGSS